MLEISSDAVARQRWENLCRGSGSTPGLPVIDFGGHVIIGYQGDEVTGKALNTLIERKSRVEPHETPPKPATVDDAAIWLLPSQNLLGALQLDSSEATDDSSDLAEA